MNKRTRDEIDHLTVAEVRRQAAVFSEKRRAVIAELATIQTTRQKGAPPALLLSDHEKQAHSRAVQLLNGHAGILKLPEAGDREAELMVEADALDLVLRGLRDQEAIARAADAVRWVEANKGKWAALCRDIVLTAVKLQALEQRARDMIAELPDWAPGLALGGLIGGRSIYDGSTEDPTREARDAALAQGVVSDAEIRKAQNV
jgi:hypothetical protein